MKTNFIIICAGEQSRWNNYLNSNKHLITIDGKRLLDMNIDLIKKYFTDSDIYVVALTDEYKNDKSILYKPTLNSENLGLDKFLSSQNLWSNENRNIILYGDVYFSPYLVKLMSIIEKKDWFLFARYANSYLYKILKQLKSI